MDKKFEFKSIEEKDAYINRLLIENNRSKENSIDPKEQKIEEKRSKKLQENLDPTYVSLLVEGMYNTRKEILKQKTNVEIMETIKEERATA